MFVQVPTGENRALFRAARIENAPPPPRVLSEVATVDAHRLERDALPSKPGGKGHRLARRNLGVIGIDEENGVVRMGAGEMLEGDRFIVMRLNERMGHGAKHWDIVENPPP